MVLEAEKFKMEAPVNSLPGKSSLPGCRLPPSGSILTWPVEGEGREREKGERRLSDISSYKDTNQVRALLLRPHLTYLLLKRPHLQT